MNNDGENAGGAPHMQHYGQPQHLQVPPPPPQQQQDAPNYNPTQALPPPPQPQPQHIPGAAVVNPTTTFGAHSILMNNATAVSRRRTGEDDQEHLRTGIQPTPLFERLVTEEVQELKAYARIIENQNRRLAELERVHGDLEVRLEGECKARMRLEATLEEHELAWTERYAKLEKDRDHWKEVVQLEQTKNSRLIEQVVRKEKDIQKMLQRKYDQPPREGAHYNQSGRNFRQGPNDKERSSTPTSRSPSLDQHKSPHEILFDNGPAEAAHPNTDPDKPRSTSPESYREGFTEGDNDHQSLQDQSEQDAKSLVLGSRVWEQMTKSSSEILVVDEAGPASPERQPLVESKAENTHGDDSDDSDDKKTPHPSLEPSANALNRLSAWSSSMRSSMISLNPLSRTSIKEPPPADWEIPKPGFKHAETQTLI